MSASHRVVWRATCVAWIVCSADLVMSATYRSSKALARKRCAVGLRLRFISRVSHRRVHVALYERPNQPSLECSCH
jgi:hypothetical protein